MAFEFYAVIDGEQKGPFGQADLSAMIESGEVRADTHVWREGMDEWAGAASVPEIAELIVLAEE